MNRNDYMEKRVDFQTYHLHLADTIGRKALEHLVLRGVASIETLVTAHKEDVHFNTIPLRLWDVQDSWVRDIIAQSSEVSARVHAITWPNTEKPKGVFYWSLSETVCVLKAVARRLVEEYNANQSQTKL